MKDKVIELVDKFKKDTVIYTWDNNGYKIDEETSLINAKNCTLISIDFAEKELAKHGVIRKEYYEDFRNEIQKL